MILKDLKGDSLDLLFSSVFLFILQMFSSEVTLICDQIWINIGAYDCMTLRVAADQQTLPIFC